LLPKKGGTSKYCTGPAAHVRVPPDSGLFSFRPVSTRKELFEEIKCRMFHFSEPNNLKHSCKSNSDPILNPAKPCYMFMSVQFTEMKQCIQFNEMLRCWGLGWPRLGPGRFDTWEPVFRPASSPCPLDQCAEADSQTGVGSKLSSETVLCMRLRSTYVGVTVLHMQSMDSNKEYIYII